MNRKMLKVHSDYWLTDVAVDTKHKYHLMEDQTKGKPQKSVFHNKKIKESYIQ